MTQSVFKTIPQRWPQKRVVIGLIVTILVIIASVMGLKIFGGKPSGSETSLQHKTICQEQTIKAAAAHIKTGKTYELGMLIESEIKNQKDYNKDINCLYTVINYYFLNNITQGTDGYIANYKEFYSQGYRPSAIFGSPMSAKEIDERVTTISEINSVYDQFEETQQGDSPVGDGSVLQ